jgi:hypothetical protein
MDLRALFVVSGEFGSISMAEARQRVAEGAVALVDLPWPDQLAATLETIKIQLEGDHPGARFPALWSLGVALVDDGPHGWTSSDAGDVVSEIDTVLGELEALPIGLGASVMLGDDGVPEFYSRVTPQPEGWVTYDPPNLRTRFGPTLEVVRAVCGKAVTLGLDVLLVRSGDPIRFLWKYAPPDLAGDQ